MYGCLKSALIVELILAVISSYVLTLPYSVCLARSQMWITLCVLTVSRVSIPLRVLFTACSVQQVVHL